jgi:signal transduction histidine kinase
VKNLSLTRRLVIILVASQLVLALGLTIVAIAYTRYQLQSAFDVNLEGRALSVAALVYYPDNHNPGLLFDASKVPPSPHVIHKDIYLIRSDRGGFEVYKEGYDPAIFNNIPKSGRFWDFEVDGEPYRAIILRDVPVLDTESGVPPPLPRLTVIYAAPTMDIPQGLGALAASIGGASLLVLLPTLLVGSWSVRRRLLPLRELAAEARGVSVRHWDFNPSSDARQLAELEPLIAAIETSLDGLKRAFKRQREFVGDAAHELKTAHAILKSSLQLTLNRNRTGDEYRAALLELSGDSDRLEELLNRMLRLARVEQWAADGIQRALEPTDIAYTCEMAVARIAALANGRTVKVLFTNDNTAQIQADSADLELVWINLLENAVQHSSAGSEVAIHLQVLEDTAHVYVEDAGPGIAQADLPHIFERFRRGDPSRSRTTGGFGLGLAIAKSVIEAYEGTIRAESKLGQGTRISVTLPLRPETFSSGKSSPAAAIHTG